MQHRVGRGAPEVGGELPRPGVGRNRPGCGSRDTSEPLGSVGVIGTKGTIASRAYQSRLEARGFRVWAQACPMLVHVVEEGLCDAPEAELLVRHYLKGRPEIDTLILGCTHYPLLREAIARSVGPGVTLVDSAEVIAGTGERGLSPAAAMLSSPAAWSTM